MKKTRVSYFGSTDVGCVRDHNEDSFLIMDLSNVEGNDFGIVLMIADGMGGANAGEVASDIACKVVEDRYLKLRKAPSSHRDIEKYLKNLILEGHHQILQHASENPACEGMGTTAVIAWLLHNYLHVVWCGDSRCYIYQKRQQFTLSPFTDDHSLVWQMVKAGEITAEEARMHEQSNIILQVLGSSEARPAPSYLKRKWNAEDNILLCSDGLNGMISDANIQQILEGYEQVEEVVQNAIDSAKKAGGTDNITVIFARVNEEGSSKGMSEGKGGVQRAWLFILAFAALIVILFFVIRSRYENASEKVRGDLNFDEAVAAQAGVVSKETEPESTLQSKTHNRQKNQTRAKATVHEFAEPGETYDFHTELIKLKEAFEGEKLKGRELLEGCEDCDYNPELEKFNSYVTGTEAFLSNQIALAQDSSQLTEASRQQLKELTASLEVHYDPQQVFEVDSFEEQRYVVATLAKVISKIDEEMKRYTTTLQKKNYEP